MAYPQLVPTARAFNPGDFANKKYNAQDGAEFRILYGDKRVGMTLQLTYKNISDLDASSFLDHYHSVQGTFQQFELNLSVKSGWEQSPEYLGAVFWGSLWRYDSAPQLESVYPGVSSVTVNLKAATI